MREPDVQLRYDPIIRFLKTHRIEGNILEIGGGVAGIAQFLDTPVTGCDPYFLSKKGKRADWQGRKPLPNIVPIGGTATNIPFPDNAFPFVVSSDMLEHLPKPLRQKAIREMLRVSSRYVVFGFPCGSVAARAERLLFCLGKTLLGKEHRWLKEHLQHGLPTEQEVTKFLNGLVFQSKGNTNVGSWALVTIASAIARPLGWLFYPLALLQFPPYYRNLVIIDKRSPHAD